MRTHPPIAENTLQVATDWLAVGLDPEKSTLFIQSSVLEHAELHVLLSMITPLSLARARTRRIKSKSKISRTAIWGPTASSATRSCSPPIS